MGFGGRQVRELRGQGGSVSGERGVSAAEGTRQVEKGLLGAGVVPRQPALPTGQDFGGAQASPNSARVTVDFDIHGRKQMLLRYAKLERAT